MKKMITVLLLAAISLSASADKDIYQDQLLFHCFDDGTAEVRRSDYHDTREMDIVIPETVEADGKTYTVTSIGDEVFGYEINSITLPNTIRRKDIRNDALGFNMPIEAYSRVDSIYINDKPEEGKLPLWASVRSFSHVYSVAGGSNGSLTGYAAGLKRKQGLLDIERG